MASKTDKLLQQLQANLQNLQAKYDQQVQALNTPDPYTKMIGDQASGVLEWAKGGDYSQPPKGVFFNFVDPAARKRQRELNMSAMPQGIAAFGAPNTTLLNLNKQTLDDEFDRDQAANYQGQIADTVNRAAGIAGNLGDQQLNTKLQTLNLTANQLGGANNSYTNLAWQNANKPSGWSKFLSGLTGGLVGAGLNYATGGLSSLFNKAPMAGGHAGSSMMSGGHY